jgi:hypothetical protein
MAYAKYTKTSDDCYESTEPSSTGSRTLEFSEKQDAIWIRVLVGTDDRGNVTWDAGGTHTLEIDGITMEVQTGVLLEVEAKEIRYDVGTNASALCWFQIIGLKKE